MASLPGADCRHCPFHFLVGLSRMIQSTSIQPAGPHTLSRRASNRFLQDASQYEQLSKEATYGPATEQQSRVFLSAFGRMKAEYYSATDKHVGRSRIVATSDIDC
ncbi:hypothetical protein DL546_005557 [Coniochaeta pulveracea]|uniref:Uncharacterized protein n=1 Tax=Coniochaeta pulveracea TaxID=177199 RepID=A0A420Y4Y6_9PEZI|nr:hypothetical protein DL546_005557 [Coniochaeta pulveracea]